MDTLYYVLLSIYSRTAFPIFIDIRLHLTDIAKIELARFLRHGLDLVQNKHKV